MKQGRLKSTWKKETALSKKKGKLRGQTLCAEYTRHPPIGGIYVNRRTRHSLRAPQIPDHYISPHHIFL